MKKKPLLIYTLPSLLIGLIAGFFINNSNHLLGLNSLNTIALIELYDSHCYNCSSLYRHEDFIESFNITPLVRRIDYYSVEGMSLVSNYSITELPTVIIKGLELYPELQSFYLTLGTIEPDNSYVFRTNLALGDFYYERFNSQGELLMINTKDINVTGKEVLGDEGAKVSIIEFFDYSCESCNLSRMILSDLLYLRDVNFYFKHYPLDLCANVYSQGGSCLASVAAECAARQGKFWEYSDLLFDNADFSITALKTYALFINLSVSEFNYCLDNLETLVNVMQDIDDGFYAGVIGTPSFYVNGKVILGLQSLSVFLDFIDSFN